MPNAFLRTQMLLGQAAMQRLASSSVAVFGVGGVGSYAVEALARCGVGKLTLFDHDEIALSNLNRQIIALHSTIGRKKVDVLRERVLDINPCCEVTANTCFYAAHNADTYDLAAYTYIVDAIDTVLSKLLLVQRAHAAAVPIISCMGAGNKLDPTRLEVADIYSTSVCPLARVMRKELKARGVPALKVVYSREPVARPQVPAGGDIDGAGRRQIPGSVSFVPPAAGLIIAGEVVKDIVQATPAGAQASREYA